MQCSSSNEMTMKISLSGQIRQEVTGRSDLAESDFSEKSDLAGSDFSEKSNHALCLVKVTAPIDLSNHSLSHVEILPVSQNQRLVFTCFQRRYLIEEKLVSSGLSGD